jgi:hypothetical protein
MDLLAAKSCGGAEGDGKTAVVLEPRRGRSDHGREEGACSKADQHAVGELELSGSKLDVLATEIAGELKGKR